MARISKFTRVDKKRTAHRQTVTSAHYGVFEEAGVKYLQIETVGSSGREVKGVTSQTILLDESVLPQLIAIIREVLPSV